MRNEAIAESQNRSENLDERYIDGISPALRRLYELWDEDYPEIASKPEIREVRRMVAGIWAA